MSDDVIDVVPEPEDDETTSQELVPAAPATLVGTNDPVVAIERLTKISDSLKRLVDSKGLVVRISNKEYPTVAAWQTLGVLLGVTAITVWTKPLPDGDGWEARVEARTLDGQVVGAAESMCSRDENNWKSRDDNALRSMAQTRATSKAMRGPLGFVMQLAGYEATPAEEMDRGRGNGAAQPAPKRPQATASEPAATVELATPAQRRLMFARARDGGLTDENELRAIFSYVAGTPHSDRIPFSMVDEVIGAIENHQAVLQEIHTQANAGEPSCERIVEAFLKGE